MKLLMVAALLLAEGSIAAVGGTSAGPPAARGPATTAVAPQAPTRRPDVIFIATPEPTVRAMLREARVGPADVVYDLGSGDGRIVIAAAKEFGARGVGIEIDPKLVTQANEAARAAGVSDRVRFIIGDLFEADIREATVVTLFLLPSLNERLKPKLIEQLRAGARIVSHAWNIESWPHERSVDAGGLGPLYFWTAPGNEPRQQTSRTGQREPERAAGPPPTPTFEPRGAPAPAAGGPSGGSSLPALGVCGLTPNYASSVRLERWQGGANGLLQVTVSVNAPPRFAGLTPAAATRYESGATFGAGLWESAIANKTGRAFLRIRVARNDPSAPIQINLANTAPEASARTGTQSADARPRRAAVNGHSVIVGSEITIYRPTNRGAETLLNNGVWSELQFEVHVAKLVAHEIGHSLGIITHSPSSGLLMSDGGDGKDVPDTPRQDYNSWITEADANTLSHAYCGDVRGAQDQPGSSLVQRQPSPVSSPSSFSASWSCRVDSAGYDGFVIRPDGTVRFGMGFDDVRSSISGNELRFEQTDPTGQGFFTKRVFAFRLVNGELRGTRTETSRFGNSTSQYVCKRD